MLQLRVKMTELCFYAFFFFSFGVCPRGEEEVQALHVSPPTMQLYREVNVTVAYFLKFG